MCQFWLILEDSNLFRQRVVKEFFILSAVSLREAGGDLPDLELQPHY